jgi:large subunit ribosomal protein L18e
MHTENTKINRWIETLTKSKSTAKNRKLLDYLITLASKPKRQRVSVNLYKLEQLSNDNENIVVPGKVLGAGEIKKSINITAIDFSSSALEKLKGSKCKIVDLSDMVSKGGARIII